MTRFSRAVAAQDPDSSRVCRLLAQRLYLVREALVALDAGEPQDAHLVVRASDGGSHAHTFAQELVAMYRAWAEKRGMKLDELDPARGAPRSTARFAISGFAASRILMAEDGLHVLETPRREGSFTRAGAVVQVTPVAPAAEGSELSVRARGMRPQHSLTPEVVRRYRREPSPLVRDRSGWRTGRLQAVLGGDFDLFANTDA